MPAVGTDLLIVQRGGINYKAAASEIAALASGGSYGAHVAIKPPVNGFAHMALNAGALATVTAAINRLDLVPFIPAKAITVNQLNLEVTTLLAASTARLGIYASDAGSVPSTLIQQGATTIDCATVGDKSTAVTATVLAAGTLYWIAIATSGAQTFRGLPLTSLMCLPGDATITGVYTLRRATFTYASLPATAPTSVPTSSIAPFVRLRVSA